MNAIQGPVARESAIKHLRFQTSPPHRILMVDDDEALRQLNTAVLLRAGYQVDAAEDGASAWESLCADGYDLMITDNNMPKLTGLELLEKLHSSRLILPVIMATGAEPREAFARAPWLRPAATLIKPYSNAELLRTVKKVLREADGQSIAPPPATTGEEKAGAFATVEAPSGASDLRPVNPPRRILVVDQDSDLRLLYADALTAPDYHVATAEDGAAAWEALQGNSYDLLITEHDLPKLNGLELVRKVRAAHMALPIVMAAGVLPTHELGRDPSLRVAATLAKPFAVNALLDTVRNALRATASLPEPIDQLPD